MFYVVTKGRHPFGPVIKRQANIAAGDYDLTLLCGQGIAFYFFRHSVRYMCTSIFTILLYICAHT